LADLATFLNISCHDGTFTAGFRILIYQREEKASSERMAVDISRSEVRRCPLVPDYE